MKVDPGKEYQTRAGKRVTDLTVDFDRREFCVEGHVDNCEESWDIFGSYWANGEESIMDLVLVEQKKVAKKTTKKPVKRVVSRKKSVPKEPMVVSMEKCYETKCGYPVRIYATDQKKPYNVHGALYRDGNWYDESWTSEGAYLRDGSLGDMNLVEAPKRVTVTQWVNVTECCGQYAISEGYDSEAHAANSTGKLAQDETLFARVKVEVKCSQGEGL